MQSPMPRTLGSPEDGGWGEREDLLPGGSHLRTVLPDHPMAPAGMATSSQNWEAQLLPRGPPDSLQFPRGTWGLSGQKTKKAQETVQTALGY